MSRANELRVDQKLRDGVSIHDLYRVIRKRRIVFLSAFLACMALAVVYLLVTKKQYDATARLTFNFSGSNALGLDQIDQELAGADVDTKVNTQVNVLTTGSLAWKVIRDLNLGKYKGRDGKIHTVDYDHPNPQERDILIQGFEANLKVTPVPKTTMVEIKYRSTDPVLAQKIVNELTKDYMQSAYEGKFNAAQQAAEWLSDQLAGLKQNVEQSEQKLADFQRQHGILGTDQSNNTVMATLIAMEQQLVQARSQRVFREAQYRIAASGNPELVQAASMMQGGGASEQAANDTIRQLRDQQIQLQNQYTQATAKFGRNYPRVVELRAQISKVNGELERQDQNLITTFKNNYESSLHAEQTLQSQVSEQEKRGFDLVSAAAQFQVMQHEDEAERDLYDDLFKKVKESGVLAGLQTTNVLVADPAEVPAFPAVPNPKIVFTVLAFAGLLAGTALVFLFENLDRRVSGPEDIEERCALTVMGSVLKLPNPSRRDKEERSAGALPLTPSSVMMRRPKSAFSESLRSLRTAVMLSTSGKPPRIIVVTSSLPSEGKSTVSLNLAIAMAQSGSRVLVIDADMRRPRLHSALSEERGVGLSDVLAGLAKTSAAIRRHPDLDGLFWMSSGSTAPNPAKLLSGVPCEELLEECAARYDHIVIDTPPLLAVTDAALLARFADSVLLIARVRFTNLQSLTRTRDLLRRLNIPISGVVVNGFDPKSGGYYDYYGHGPNAYSGYYTDEEVVEANPQPQAR